MLPVRGTIVEDSGCTVLGRLAINGALATQAAISSITYSVFDASSRTPTSPIDGHDEVAVNKATTVFNSLQTDGRWSADETGYNFRHELAASAFPIGGRRYLIEYRFTPASGQPFTVLYEVYAIRVLGS